MTPEPPLTRADVAENVGDVVGEIFNDALNHINTRFNSQDAKIDVLTKEVRDMNDWLGDHELRLRLLERAGTSV